MSLITIIATFNENNTWIQWNPVNKVTNGSKFSHIYLTFPSFLKQLERRYRVLRTVSYVLNIINNFFNSNKGIGQQNNSTCHYVVPKIIHDHTSPTEGICPYIPPNRWKFQSIASYIYLNFWAFENPTPPRNFQSFPWGEYEYFSGTTQYK